LSPLRDNYPSLDIFYYEYYSCLPKQNWIARIYGIKRPKAYLSKEKTHDKHGLQSHNAGLNGYDGCETIIHAADDIVYYQEKVLMYRAKNYRQNSYE